MSKRCNKYPTSNGIFLLGKWTSRKKCLININNIYVSTFVVSKKVVAPEVSMDYEDDIKYYILYYSI